MRGATLVALAASIGNFLQGWDNATIAGAIVYIKKDMDVGISIEGLIVAMSLIGATAITTCSGPVSDWLGRRPMLIISSLLYFASGLLMLWTPNVYILCLARLLDGFGIGLAVTLVPVYISETAPPEIRGLLNTLPQFAGSGGMFLSYCMVFGMSLNVSPSWRLMLGVLSIPSVLYFVLTVFFLPESPRWLVSKGKMDEAKQVLQRLRGREDVAGEMALLVEGLGIGGEKSVEEYIIGPDFNEPSFDKNRIQLYGAEEGVSWIARPVTEHSSLTLSTNKGGSMINQTSVPLMDPLVSLFSSVHEKLPGVSNMSTTLFPTFESLITKPDNWDEENLLRVTRQNDDSDSDDNNIRSPLITLSQDKFPQPSQSNFVHEETSSSLGIGGGWQLAWKWTEKDGDKDGELQRVYLHQEVLPVSKQESFMLAPGHEFPRPSELVHVAALVSHSALNTKDLVDHQRPFGPVMVHPAETASKGPVWSALLDPGIKRALVVGIGIQILQQFAGISGVLYYTPQILEQAGVGILLANMGLTSLSASFLISTLTTLLMLPCIVVAMRLMDISGRRWLLLATIPVLILSLLVLIITELINSASVIRPAISTACVIIYICCFVMGFGPIPNILCSEIFPTRARGLCIAICSMVFWISDIIVTYTLPVMLTSIGLAGVFSIYVAVCIVAWIFVYLKVPETKGMPLEVITEFFAVGAAKTAEKTE